MSSQRTLDNVKNDIEDAVALGVDTTGNYISTVTGTANEIEITNGTGSEGAAVIVGTVGAAVTVGAAGAALRHD